MSYFSKLRKSNKGWTPAADTLAGRLPLRGGAGRRRRGGGAQPEAAQDRKTSSESNSVSPASVLAYLTREAPRRRAAIRRSGVGPFPRQPQGLPVGRGAGSQGSGGRYGPSAFDAGRDVQEEPVKGLANRNHPLGLVLHDGVG